MIKKIKTFLFKNVTLKQTIVKNATWIAISYAGSRALKLLLIIYVARILDVREYGIFSFTVAVAGVFTLFSDFGITPFLYRESSRNSEERTLYVNTAFVIKLGFILIGSLCIFLFFPYIAGPNIPYSTTTILTIIVLFASDTMRDFCVNVIRSLEKMELEAFANIIAHVVLIGATLLALHSDKTSYSLLLGYAVGSGIGIALLLLPLRTMITQIRTTFSRKLVMPIITKAWPFGIIAMLTSLLFGLDTLMVGWMRSAEEVGLYSAAQRIMIMLYLVPGLVAQSTMPSLFRFATSDRPALQKLLNESVAFSLYLALPMLFGGMILAPDIIRIAFGSQYLAVVPTFRIMMLMILFVFPNGFISVAGLSLNIEKKLMRYLGISVLVNLVLNLVLINSFGINGATTATLIAYALYTICSLIYVSSVVKIQFKNTFIPLALASIIMAAVTYGMTLAAAPFLINVLVSAVVFVGMLYLQKDKLLLEFLR